MVVGFLEDLDIGEMKTAAVIGLISAGNNVRELNCNLLRLFTETPLFWQNILLKRDLKLYQRFIQTPMLSDNRGV